MKRIIGTMLGLGLAVAANASIMEGDVIKIDFGSTATTADYWNTGVISSTTHLVRMSDGANTDVDMEISSVGGDPASYDTLWVENTEAGGSDIYEVWVDGILVAGGGADELTLTFTGLDDSLTYNLFAGGEAGDGVGSTWTVSTSADGDNVETTEYQNTVPFVSFTGITSVGGTFSLNLADLNDGGYPTPGRNTGLAELTMTAIPEPATLGLIGVFGGGIFFIRRRFLI
ncbi:PEP-CTERM sorting domain-containing protein [Pontiellaceae bacterium B1224]|nr:PEP-CTERM sorting domain-containing protein [Pontiellaceae bacterium B1224]